MNKIEKIKYWITIAEYDLKTAKAMLETKRYIYVGFMCHQVIEKILKALYSKIYNETPPFTHNLLLLSNKCELMERMTESDKDFLNELLPLNIGARYPEYKNLIFKRINKTKAEEILDKTKNLFKWIKDML